MSNIKENLTSATQQVQALTGNTFNILRGVHVDELLGHNEEWIINQYNAAKSENSLQGSFRAWGIAAHMTDGGNKIIGSPSPEWVQKEKESFKWHATEFLKQPLLLNDEGYGNHLRFLFDMMRVRDHDGGYNSKQPSDLAIEIADKIIEWDLATRRKEFRAPMDARVAGKSEEEIDRLRRLVPTNIELTPEEKNAEESRRNLMALLYGDSWSIDKEKQEYEEMRNGLRELFLRGMSEDESNA